MKLLSETPARELLKEFSKRIAGFQKVPLKAQSTLALSSYSEINLEMQSHLEHLKNELLKDNDVIQKELKKRLFNDKHPN